MKRAIGEANGKVILLGEHAVVYGSPALAVGIDRGAHAEAELDDPEGASSLALGDRTVSPDRDAADDLARAFAALLEASSAPQAGVRVSARSDLPPGGGLGCSAALGVSIARAVLGLRGPPRDEDVLAAATAWERIYHGNPSGIDTAAAARGGCLVYARDAEPRVRPFEPKAEIALCIGWTGAGSSTKAMVDTVARLSERRPEVVARAVEGIASLVRNAALAVEAGDVQALGKLMDLNQMILAGLMVSNEPIEAMCELARRAGALGAKLTGAGGGGSVIALLPSPRTEADRVAARVLEAWRGKGYSGFVARASGRAKL
jgi:mevalonate kinase